MGDKSLNQLHQDGLFKVLKWLMLISGTWQLEIPNISDFQANAYKIYTVVIRIAYYIYPVAATFEFIRLLRELDPNDDVVADTIAKTLFGLLTIVKINMSRTRGIKELIEMVLEEEKKILARTDPCVKRIYKENSDFCSKTAYVFIFLALLTGNILLVNAGFNVYQFKMDPTSVDKYKIFPLKIWLPFDMYKHPEWTMFIDVIFVYLCILFLTMVIVLTNSLMIFLRAQTMILQYDLENFGYVEESVGNEHLFTGDYFTNRFKELIMNHQKLIRAVNVLNKSIKNLLFVEYSVTSLMLAGLLLQMMAKTAMFFNGLNFILTAGQLMASSWNANEIRDQSMNICTSCYKSNWYCQNMKTKTLIKIMMMRSLRPLTISLGPMGGLTVQDGVARIKIAYSYMSLMSGN